MPAQLALAFAGPPGWVAAAAITAVLIVAGAAGVFDQTEVDDDDYDDDGIYIPENPFPDPEVTVNPDETPEITVNPDETVDPDETSEEEENVDEDGSKEKDKVVYPLPFGFVSVYMTQHVEDDFDPDPDLTDIRPPSSSFEVGAEAYDSGIGYIIAAVMAGILVFWLINMYAAGGREEQ